MSECSLLKSRSFQPQVQSFKIQVFSTPGAPSAEGYIRARKPEFSAAVTITASMVSTRSQSSNPAGSTTASTNAATRTSGNPRGVQTWAHTPSNLALIWLIISIPLVLWDTGYVVLRPHSMPGGALHSPIWTPYALYGSIDYIYGWPAYNSRNGFTAAQTSLNIVESLFYMYYLWIVYQHGRPSTSQGRGAPAPRTVGWLGQAKVVVGSMGGVACTVAFSAAVMTVSKTVLYCMSKSLVHVVGCYTVLMSGRVE